MFSSDPVYKSRITTYPDNIFLHYYDDEGYVNPPEYYVVAPRKTMEWMKTYNHEKWYLKNSHNDYIRRVTSHWDAGGPWDRRSLKFSYPMVYGSRLPAGRDYFHTQWGLHPSAWYQGLCQHDLSEDPADDELFFRNNTPTGMSDNDLDEFGALAVYLTSPVNPAFSLSTALGDLLFGGAPSLVGREGNLGKEYLNLQFGWSPTISDGRGFLHAIQDYDKLISQFERDSGRLIHRSFSVPDKVTTEKTVSTNYAAGSVPPVYPTRQNISLGTLTDFHKTTQRVWFEGVFCYYLDHSWFGRRIADLNHAYGIIPGPDTLWELTPWSWLVDWFSNAGIVMRNLQNATLFGQVIPWAYVMCETVSTHEYKFEFSYRGTDTHWHNAVATGTIESKYQQRRRATPYGFGLDWKGFNPFQLSILAALGISRV